MATRVQQRLLSLAADIAASPPDDLAFQHSVLTQTSLPTSRPPAGVLVWERQQGRARLRVEAGSVLDPRTGQYVQPGLPYGPKARLLLMHLNSEAVRRQSPIIPVEDSMTAFFRRRDERRRQFRVRPGRSWCYFRLNLGPGSKSRYLSGKHLLLNFFLNRTKNLLLKLKALSGDAELVVL
jgi:hypothetical protein